ATSRAVEILRRGGVVAVPTETVYGLAALALDQSAVERVYAVKGRPKDHPLIVHLAPSADPTAWGHFDDNALVLAAAFVGGGIVVAQFLGSAIDYYCNVDEIGVRDGCDDTRRVRVQGSVDEGSLQMRAGNTSFVMSFNGVSLPVDYEGEPGGVFQECIPVVAHGRIVDGVLMATRIEVKHSNEYEAENADRLEEAEKSACS
ncbi:MAG: cytochrome c maturation protein CcmE, partial [Ilumatobacteraceae bacterium]